MICSLCPRKCNIDREKSVGFCGVNKKLRAARASLHFWEEPCISGFGGAGTVFFSGCNLRCVYCQNREISAGKKGKEISVRRLREIFDELIYDGAETIDLVTPTHFADIIAEALRAEKLPVPVVYNSGGYESAETLKMLEGLIDVYLPDYKYASASLSARLSSAPDYPETALAAIKEMHRQTGDYLLNEDGILKKGVLIRHLVLPGHINNSLDCIDKLTSAFSEKNVLLSVMSQYTPPKKRLPFEELNRRLTKEEYDEITGYLYMLGLDNIYVQELSSAQEEYTPDFDFTGI
ncbi:MAG: radical SAM protein [Oscillospiraceae bacterium]|nr:radical SAM protein [Oscillospiraceae bacterium]